MDEHIKYLNKEIKKAKEELRQLKGKTITCNDCGIDFTVPISSGRYQRQCNKCRYKSSEIIVRKGLEIEKSRVNTNEDITDDFEWEEVNDEE
jgi:hypothetical protein